MCHCCRNMPERCMRDFVSIIAREAHVVGLGHRLRDILLLRFRAEGCNVASLQSRIRNHVVKARFFEVVPVSYIIQSSKMLQSDRRIYPEGSMQAVTSKEFPIHPPNQRSWNAQTHDNTVTQDETQSSQSYAERRRDSSSSNITLTSSS
jgi:hypothetical protein